MIELHEVKSAQSSWGSGVVHIGKAQDWEEARDRATRLVTSHYLIDDGTLLFCPTKASEQQFRSTLKSAISYFVGGDGDHTEDGGFALEPWSSVRFENAGVTCVGEVALAMGNYFFGRADGTELKVEYSFAYVRDDDGKLKIHLHHSALPYSP